MGPIFVLYAGGDPFAEKEEGRRRVEAAAMIEDFETKLDESIPRAELFERIVPVPSSGDVLGYLKREIDIQVTYKRFGEFCAGDMLVMDAFWRNWIDVQMQERSLIWQRLHGES